MHRHAQSMPGKVAVRSSRVALTYQELWSEICARASALMRQSSRAYVLRASQSIDFIVAYFAAHEAGKVVVPLESDLPDAQFHEIETLVSGAVLPSEVSDILFTTGTVERQKGTMISQDAIWANADNLLAAQGYSSDLTFIITGPLNHIGSLSKLWASVVAGATVRVMDGIKNMDAFFSAIGASETPVATFMVPASLRMLMQLGKRRLMECAGKIAFVETGAAPMPQADMEELCRLLPDARLYNTYASTETGIVATHNFNGGYCVAGCLGRPMRNSEMSIDAEGFIVCRGTTVMHGYLGDEAGTASVLVNGAIRTSDKGKLDAEGRLHLSGRDGDIINVGGYKINPVEVEDAAMAMQGIADCICVPSPHPVLGTALRLLYVPLDNNRPVDKQKLARFLAANLPKFKVPQLYTQVERVERTYNGKINRKAYSGFE